MKSTYPSHTHEYVWIGDAINLSLIQAERDQNPVCGIPSGFPALDRLTRGWGEGDLVIIGGRPYSGKTALALSMARSAAVSFGVPTAYVSFGTPCLNITDRLIVSETGIPMDTLLGGAKMNQDDWQRLESSLRKLSASPLYLDCTPAGEPREYIMSEFMSKADRLVGEMKVKLFFVDAFQATIPDWVKWQPDDCLAHASRKSLRSFKEFAKSHGAAIVLLTDVGRRAGRGYLAPDLEDLDYCCPHVEDYADKTVLLHRPSLCSLVEDERTDTLELWLVQNRNGRTGRIELRFDSGRIRVVNPEDIHR